jgi:L-fuconolactonase
VHNPSQPVERAGQLRAGAMDFIIDSHVHLATADIPNDWVDTELNSEAQLLQPHTAITLTRQSKELLEASLTSEINQYNGIDVQQYIFVECFNGTSATNYMEEAVWALTKVKDDASLISGYVGHIPVPNGQQAVDDYMASIPIELFPGLRGGRVALLGNPMPLPDTCLTAKYDSGLEALEKLGLHWEWCCHPSALVSIAQACAKRPNMTFVLDHLGRNGAVEEDMDLWRNGIATLAQQPNVVVKIGGFEEWGCVDVEPLFDYAVECFGFSRLLFESNWFVSKCCGFTYERVVQTIEQAMKRNGATENDLKDVFGRNAARVYRL